jgi:hypothetical protein
MTRKTKAHSRSPAPRAEEDLYAGPWQTPPSTTEERLPRIEAMNQRINAYVWFMCKVGNVNGTSAEAKDKAVTTFYERMAALERQLGRIQEDLQIG